MKAIISVAHFLTLTTLCAALALPINSTLEKRVPHRLYVSNGPVIADIEQGTDNCWLAATLVGVARFRPDDLSHRIVQHHPSTVSISLPAIPPQSTRDRKSVAAATYDVTYHQATGVKNDMSASGGWWVAALEYALIRHTRNYGSDQGVGAPLTLGFTGLYGRHFKRNLFNHELSQVPGKAATIAAVTELLRQGQAQRMLTLLGTLTGPRHAAGETISIEPVEGDDWLVKGHAYAVANVNIRQAKVTLINPWNPLDPKTFKIKDLAPYVGEIALLDS